VFFALKIGRIGFANAQLLVKKEKSLALGNRGCGGRFVSRITYCLFSLRLVRHLAWRGFAVAGVDWANSSWGQVYSAVADLAPQWRSTPGSADVELVGKLPFVASLVVLALGLARLGSGDVCHSIFTQTKS